MSYPIIWLLVLIVVPRSVTTFIAVGDEKLQSDSFGPVNGQEGYGKNR